MALTTTTLASAVAVTDTQVVVTSATAVAAGSILLIDQEVFAVAQNYTSGTTVPVLRGRQGTKTQAHVITANVIIGTGADFAQPATQEVVSFPIAGRARTLTSYTASGAIALPTPGNDAVAVINGTSALTMTLANPTTDMDGSILWIICNGKSTSTVTYTAGFGNSGSSYDVATLPAGGATVIETIACGGFWLLASPMTGTLTSAVPALA
jgi:hypothetical protein